MKYINNKRLIGRILLYGAIAFLLSLVPMVLFADWTGDPPTADRRYRVLIQDILTGDIITSRWGYDTSTHDFMGYSHFFALDNAYSIGDQIRGALAVYLSDAGVAPTTNGEIRYNASNNRFEFYQNGAVATLSGAGANTALSNLSSVAINEALISDTDLTDDLGSAITRWKVGYLGRLIADREGVAGTANIPGTTNIGIKGTALNGTINVGGVFSGTQADIDLSNSTLRVGGITDYTLPPDGSNLQHLQTNGSGTLSWTTPTYANSYTASNLLYASSANTVTGLATANNGVLVTGGTGVPSIATNIPTAVTIGTAYIYRVGGTDVAVADGGTGASTLADGGLIIGNGTSAVEVVAAGATTQILVGGGASTAPIWGTDIPTAVTIGSGYIYRVGGTDVAVADGGTGKSSWTQYLIPYADTTTSLSQIAIGTDGQVLTSGGAGVAPAFENAPAPTGTKLLVGLKDAVVTATASATMQSIILAANSYSRVMIEGHGFLDQSTDGNVQTEWIIKVQQDGATIGNPVVVSADATGAGDYWSIPWTIWASVVDTAGSVFTIVATELIDSAATLYSNDIELYGIQ